MYKYDEFDDCDPSTANYILFYSIVTIVLEPYEIKLYFLVTFSALDKDIL